MARECLIHVVCVWCRVCVCVCVSVSVRVRVWVRVCVCVCVSAKGCVEPPIAAGEICAISLVSGPNAFCVIESRAFQVTMCMKAMMWEPGAKLLLESHSVQ